MSSPFDITALPEDHQVAFYGCLFALAAADGEVGKEEAAAVLETLDSGTLSNAAKRQIHGYLLAPPAFTESLGLIAQAGAEFRYAALVRLVEVALADGPLAEEERRLLDESRAAWSITLPQLEAIEHFVRESRRIRERGIDDPYAAQALREAIAGLGAVGVPLAAVYFSGSVIGLSAAGITSGLAALGLGLGMVPGIGIAIALGTAIFFGIRWLLGRGVRQREEQVKTERERRAQLVIKNLQEAITIIIDRLNDLEAAADVARVNEEAIRRLHDRLRALQQLLASRKGEAAA